MRSMVATSIPLPLSVTLKRTNRPGFKLGTICASFVLTATRSVRYSMTADAQRLRFFLPRASAGSVIWPASASW